VLVCGWCRCWCVGGVGVGVWVVSVCVREGVGGSRGVLAKTTGAYERGEAC
jgi:hypothetical protein